MTAKRLSELFETHATVEFSMTRQDVTDVVAALKDQERLGWLIAAFSDPANSPIEVAEKLQPIIAGARVDGQNYGSARAAIDAAMKGDRV